MKKTKLLMPLAGITALGAVAAPLVVMSGCSTNKCTVSFDYRDGTITKVEVQIGSTVSKPEDPSAQGFTFRGWFVDKEATKSFNFSSPINQSITLYAGWDFVGVQGVQLKSKPAKLDYIQGERLNLDGLAVTAKLNDGTTVDVPQGYYRTDPEAGTLLVTEGTHTIDVIVGEEGSEKTTSFNVEVKPFVLYLEVESKLDFDYVPVGTVVSKSDFTVTAHYSLFESEVVTDWTCNLFPGETTTYRFSDAGEKNVTIEYNGQSWTETANIYYDNLYQFTTPQSFTLPMCTTEGDDAFQTSKEITLLNAGEIVDPSEYKVTLKAGSENYLSVSKNVITTKAPGTAEIIIYDKTGVDVITDHIFVTVTDITAPSIKYHDYSSIPSYADFNLFEKNTDYDCVLPDKIIHKYDGADKEYLIRLNGSVALQTVKDLYLPHKLYGIWPDATSTNFDNLQSVYFDGTQAEWAKVEQYRALTNDYITGVQCNDGFLQIDEAHVKAQYRLTQLEKVTLAYATEPFTKQISDTTIQMDFTDWSNAASVLSTNITFFNYYSSASGIDVYKAKGGIVTKLTSSDFTFTQDGSTNNYTLKFTDDSKIVGHNIVIKAHGTFTENGLVATATNVPTKLNVRSHRERYSVGDHIYTYSVHLEYVLLDGTKIDVPDEYVRFVNIPDGYEFTEDDKTAGQKTIEVNETLFGTLDKVSFIVKIS